MSGETTLTVIGNITNDPELRFTPNGAAVANFTIASTPRVFDRQSNEWKDGETLFLRSSIWRDPAENVAETLKKGTRVIAEGQLKQRKYTPKEGGDERTVIEFEVSEIGPSLRYAKAVVTRVDGGGPSSGGGQQGGFGGGQQGGQQQQGWGGQQQPAQQGWGGQQTQQAPQGQQQGYAPQNGAQGGYGQQAAQDDPWATPGVSNPGGQQGWGQQPQQGNGPGF